MHPLAHHLGEDSLVNLLLLGSGGLSLMAVAGRARLAAIHARLTRRSRGGPGNRTGRATTVRGRFWKA
jgi:hypothetical protein